MLIIHSLAHSVHQQIQFGRRDVVVRQAFGHRGDAPQFAHGLKHDELRLLDALGGNVVFHLLVVMAPALFVEVGLCLLHLHEERLLHAVGQIL